MKKQDLLFIIVVILMGCIIVPTVCGCQTFSDGFLQDKPPFLLRPANKAKQLKNFSQDRITSYAEPVKDTIPQIFIGTATVSTIILPSDYGHYDPNIIQTDTMCGFAYVLDEHSEVHIYKVSIRSEYEPSKEGALAISFPHVRKQEVWRMDGLDKIIINPEKIVGFTFYFRSERH